jgi:hypothetical protein
VSSTSNDAGTSTISDVVTVRVFTQSCGVCGKESKGLYYEGSCPLGTCEDCQGLGKELWRIWKIDERVRQEEEKAARRAYLVAQELMKE